MISFLPLTSDVSKPFVIPSLSPVSQPSSRKNSDASITDLEKLEKVLSGNENVRPVARQNSISLL